MSEEAQSLATEGGPARLVYLSPLPYESFAQRPHRFVDWFHDRTGGDVLWVDPYPTRLPRLSDVRRPRGLGGVGGVKRSWLRTCRPRSLPIEPLPGGSRVNRLLWRNTLRQVQRFCEPGAAVLAIGKPSALADLMLERFSDIVSIYDMMDNFPAFYRGLSARSMERCERRIVERAENVVCSSTNLWARAVRQRSDARLLLNALDPDPRFAMGRPSKDAMVRARIFGYVGTIADWFDWVLVRDLALARPGDIVRLIGPLFERPPYELPSNVELRPAVCHADAIGAMLEFDVGLIPFKDDALTSCVDPIKYYEYRAVGLPIITNRFGEMTRRLSEDGVFALDDAQSIAAIAASALRYRADESRRSSFVTENSWCARFDNSVLAELHMLKIEKDGRF